jgi:hypothetical protein
MPPAFILSQDQTLKFDVRIYEDGIFLINPLILRSLAYTKKQPKGLLPHYGNVLDM